MILALDESHQVGSLIGPLTSTKESKDNKSHDGYEHRSHSWKKTQHVQAVLEALPVYISYQHHDKTVLYYVHYVR